MRGRRRMRRRVVDESDEEEHEHEHDDDHTHDSDVVPKKRKRRSELSNDDENDDEDNNDGKRARKRAKSFSATEREGPMNSEQVKLRRRTRMWDDEEWMMTERDMEAEEEDARPPQFPVTKKKRGPGRPRKSEQRPPVPPKTVNKRRARRMSRSPGMDDDDYSRGAVRRRSQRRSPTSERRRLGRRSPGRPGRPCHPDEDGAEDRLSTSSIDSDEAADLLDDIETTTTNTGGVATSTTSDGRELSLAFVSTRGLEKRRGRKSAVAVALENQHEALTRQRAQLAAAQADLQARRNVALTYAEKAALCQAVRVLDFVQMKFVVQIIAEGMNRMDLLHVNDVDLDIERIDTPVLREVQQFLANPALARAKNTLREIDSKLEHVEQEWVAARYHVR